MMSADEKITETVHLRHCRIATTITKPSIPILEGSVWY
jgi:hypothetical protein